MGLKTAQKIKSPARVWRVVRSAGREGALTAAQGCPGLEGARAISEESHEAEKGEALGYKVGGFGFALIQLLAGLLSEQMDWALDRVRELWALCWLLRRWMWTR